MSSLGSERAPAECSNCGWPLAGGSYCGRCGQRAMDHRQPLRALVGELQDQVFAFDARSWRTLVTLIRRPGQLTVEYNAGHRVRSVPPLRLYLLVSFFFFIAVQLSNQQIVKFGSSLSLPEDGVVVGAPEAQTPALADDDLEAETAAEESEEESWFIALLTNRLEHVEENFDDPEAEINKLVNRRVPQTMFFLVPMMALILKLAYWRRRKFYIEHLVFAVHAHAAIFLALLVAILLNVALSPLWEHARLLGLPIMAAMAVHFFKSLRRVYQQSRLLTACKWWVIAAAYLFNLTVALLAVFLVSLLLI